MITQYTTAYSSPPSDFQNLIANKCSLLNKYVLMQTGQNEYTALIYNMVTKDCKSYRLSRSSGTNNYYTVTETSTTFDYRVTNEYYVYSNDGIGKSLSLPVYDGIIAFSITAICVVLFFAIMFKGVLFRCLKSLKRR